MVGSKNIRLSIVRISSRLTEYVNKNETPELDSNL